MSYLFYYDYKKKEKKGKVFDNYKENKDFNNIKKDTEYIETNNEDEIVIEDQA